MAANSFFRLPAAAAHPSFSTQIQDALWPTTMPTDPAAVARGYNALADTYAKQVLQDGWAVSFDRVREEIGEFLQEREVATTATPLTGLDAGCGDGLLAQHITFPVGSQLDGIDLSQSLTDIANNRGKYRDLRVGNLEDPLPFKKGGYNLVISNGVLGYVGNTKPLPHMLNALVPGGRAVLCFRHENWEERGWENAVIAEKGASLVGLRLFDPFPKNDAYTHDYVCAVVEKRG